MVKNKFALVQLVDRLLCEDNTVVMYYGTCCVISNCTYLVTCHYHRKNGHINTYKTSPYQTIKPFNHDWQLKNQRYKWPCQDLTLSIQISHSCEKHAITTCLQTATGINKALNSLSLGLQCTPCKDGNNTKCQLHLYLWKAILSYRN